jgi:peroxiredoxin Q/BCP
MPATHARRFGILAFAFALSVSTAAGANARPRPAAAARESAAPIVVGKRAPDFTLTSSSGGTIRLSGLRGKTVVLYFYPKDETPGCTREACDFRDHYAALDSAGVVLLGVSNDDLKSHRDFTAKEHLPFPLLADVDASVSRQYGVYVERELGGKKVMGIERTTFVIDRSGRLARVWPKVTVDGHVADVLAFVRGR